MGGGGAVVQERPGVHSAPRTDPNPSGSRGQRLLQTTRTQLGKAEDQRCMDPGVKYKMAEWGGRKSQNKSKRSLQENTQKTRSS